MRSESQIRRKIKQVRFRILQKALRDGLRRKPCRCRFHGVVEFTNGRKVGVCRYREISGDDDWYTTICDDDTHEGREQANACSVYERNLSKEEIKVEVEKEMDIILHSGDVARIATHYPDIMALLWVLDRQSPLRSAPLLDANTQTDEDLLNQDPNKMLEKYGPRGLAQRVVLDLEGAGSEGGEDTIVTNRSRLFQTFLLFTAAIGDPGAHKGEGLGDEATQRNNVGGPAVDDAAEAGSGG